MTGTIGQPETGSGSVTPQVVTGEAVTVVITKPDGTKEAPITANAAADGSYTITYTPQLAGTFTAAASVAQQTTSTEVLSAATGTGSFTVPPTQINRSISIAFSP